MEIVLIKLSFPPGTVRAKHWLYCHPFIFITCQMTLLLGFKSEPLHFFSNYLCSEVTVSLQTASLNSCYASGSPAPAGFVVTVAVNNAGYSHASLVQGSLILMHNLECFKHSASFTPIYGAEFTSAICWSLDSITSSICRQVAALMSYCTAVTAERC